MTTAHQVADTLRIVALRLEQAIETGHHGTEIDTFELIGALTSVADEIRLAAADQPTIATGSGSGAH